jgi:hypothetical protein
MRIVRPAAVIGLIQVGIIVGGILFVSACLRAFGYPSNDNFRWNPVAVFIRSAGLTFLLLPIIWTLVAVLVERNDLWFLSEPRFYCLGAVLCLFLICFFVTTGLNCGAYMEPIWH